MKNSPTKTPAVHPAAGSWEKAAQWADAARKFARCTLAAQVMAGFELLALHQAHDVQPGGDRAKPHDAVLLWPELVRQHLGISDDTARRWMAMAEYAGERLKLLAGVDLTGTSLAELPAKQLGHIEAVVQDLTDGKTQATFLREIRALRVDPDALDWGDQDRLRYEDMRILAKQSKGKLTADAAQAVDELDEEGRVALEHNLPSMMTRCEIGELKPARAWAGLFGGIATAGKARRAVDHGDNLLRALAKFETSLPHWYEVKSHFRDAYIEKFTHLLQTMPEEVRKKIAVALQDQP